MQIVHQAGSYGLISSVGAGDTPLWSSKRNTANAYAYILARAPPVERILVGEIANLQQTPLTDGISPL